MEVKTNKDLEILRKIYAKFAPISTDYIDFRRELERPELKEVRKKIPVAVGILTGLRIQNVDMRHIQNQVRVARELSLDGVSFFFYETLGQRDASFETLFFTPAIRPDLRNIARS